MKSTIYFLLAISLTSSFTLSAEKPAPKQTVTSQKAVKIQSGVVFTFDDRFIDQWVKQIPLFKRYGARVTFFVDHFHTLKPTQIEGLRKLKAAGHTIGCHGAKHRKAVDYVNKMGIENYLKAEINPAVKLMSVAGLKPTAFAYPSSSRNTEIDRELLKTFRHLRGGAGMSPGQRMRDLKTIFVPVDDIAKT